MAMQGNGMAPGNSVDEPTESTTPGMKETVTEGEQDEDDWLFFSVHRYKNKTATIL